MIIKNLDLRILDFVKCIFSQSLLSFKLGKLIPLHNSIKSKLGLSLCGEYSL